MTASQSLRAEAAKRILVKDGAYGTSIQDRKLQTADYCGGLDLTKDQRGNNDLLNLTKPELVRSICERFAQAGADVLATNTFNGYASPAFTLPQVPAWPYIGSAGLAIDTLFPAYYQLFNQAVDELHVQPFFNAVEPLNRRLEFVAGSVYRLRPALEKLVTDFHFTRFEEVSIM